MGHGLGVLTELVSGGVPGGTRVGSRVGTRVGTPVGAGGTLAQTVYNPPVYGAGPVAQWSTAPAGAIRSWVAVMLPNRTSPDDPVVVTDSSESAASAVDIKVSEIFAARRI